MPRYRATIKLLEIDAEKYRDNITKGLQAVFTTAARRFVEAATNRIRNQTGMTMGSFINIAAVLRITLDFSSPYTEEQLQHQRWYYGPDGSLKIPKTPEAGAYLSIPGAGEDVIKQTDKVM